MNLKSTDTIASVALVSLAAETHSHNTDQRRVSMQFDQLGNTVAALVPKSANTLPPGYYQLHVVDAAGIPSVGVIIELKI